jgi:alpha-soluble NSF attachment protein
MSDSQGDEWYDKAEKKLKSFSLFNNQAKFEDASEMFLKAANCYKMAKNWERAGASYIRAAECVVKESKHEAASNYVQASICLKKINNKDAINALRIAVEYFLDEGRFSIAAKHQKEVAEMYENEADYENCLKSFQLAADYYDGEGSTTSSNQCLLKVAQYSAQLEKYDRAIEIYEKVAKASLESNLLKWSAKDYFLRAGLCHLCDGDVVSGRKALEQYMDWDSSFSSQRECKFLEEIISAVEKYDAEAFKEAVVSYDNISKLDQWKTSILLRIKNSLKSEDSGLA